MNTQIADIGLIGLAVMGENLALNIESHGFSVAVYNRTTARVDAFVAGRGGGKRFIGTHAIEELVRVLARPRKIIMLVKAGEAVDSLIGQLTPLLEPGDILIDGGNSLFTDTIRRTRALEAQGLLYVGSGVSGGEEGALTGPSLMPGGSPAAWPQIRPIFQAICARTPEGDPCCDWMGEDGAGFPQSPMFENAVWLPKLLPGTDLHSGILLAVLAALAANFLLWRTTLGFRWRLVGASQPAARYAGVSPGKMVFSLMATAGALAGLAGAIECLGVHYRLIEGFSAGFGFNAVAIALMGALNPLYVLPSALFFGFLETGALAMQRQVGVPSSLVLVIQGLTMVFVLCAIGRSGGEKV